MTFGLAVDDRLIDQQNVCRRLHVARVVDAAEIRNLAARQSPVPSIRPVQVLHLEGGVVDARAAGNAGVELKRRDEVVISEKVGEIERDPAADRRAVAARADGN
jgi:hypothetical protein